MSPAIVLVLLLVVLFVAAIAAWLWGEHRARTVATASSANATERQVQLATLDEKVRGLTEHLREQQQSHERTLEDTKASHVAVVGELKVTHVAAVAELKTQHASEQARVAAELEKLAGALDQERLAHGEAQASMAAAEQRESSLSENLEAAKGKVQDLVGNLETEKSARSEAEKRLVELEATLKSTHEKLSFLDDARKQLTEQMKLIASEVVEKSGKQLNDAQQERLASLLSPVKEKFEAFTKKVETTDLKRAEEQGKLAEQLQQLMKTSTELDRGARELTAALKGDNKVAGDWGELILERVLESAGLQEGREYLTQKTEKDEEGNRQRPDVVVQLPESKNLIIDSKVSLKSWSEFSTDNSDANWAAFAGSVRTHFQLLAKKDYPALYGLSSVDFTIMFIPVEPAFLELTRREPGLVQDAWNKKVMLVGPSSLQWALRMVASLWRFEDQNENAKEIAAQAGAMYDKFVGFVEDLEAIGVNLNRTSKAYNAARSKLESGRGALAGRAEKLRDLGVSPKKRLPTSDVTVANYVEGVALLGDTSLSENCN